MTDITQITLADAQRLLRVGELSSRELVQSLIDRVEVTESAVAAYVDIDFEQALLAAAAADQVSRRGSRGELAGIPIAVKDLIWTKDAPTCAGSAVLDGWTPPEDATVVSRLRDAGAIIMGKTVTHEFGASQDEPPTRNAWDTSCYPGGSSAGSGVAVAARSALAALGTDSGGSTRKPASLNGVVGLKPTYGRVSRHGVIYPGSTMDQVGPITRTVRDGALLLNVLAGHDSQDPTSARIPVPDYRRALGKPVNGLRLGIPDYYFDDDLSVSVRERITEAIASLEELGVQFTEIELPLHKLAPAAGYATLMVEQASYHHQWLTGPLAEKYQPETRHLLIAGSLIPATHYTFAQRVRRKMTEELATAFSRYALDALLTPTLPTTAKPIEETDNPTQVPSLVRYTVTSNLTGYPALSVPGGFCDRGLPVGVQLIAQPFCEDVLFQIGDAYQAVTDWHSQVPSVVS